MEGKMDGNVPVDPRCYHCKKKFTNEDLVLQHCTKEHPDNNFSMMLPQDSNPLKYQAFHYGKKAMDIDQNKFYFERASKKFISKGPKEFKDSGSPYSKVCKLSVTPKKTDKPNVAKTLFTDDLLDFSDEDKDLIHKLRSLIPSALPYLKETGNVSNWISFFELLSQGKFPTENLALKLFLDVVRFYSSCNITGMRYSADVKQFWSLGYILFKGKFVRFMGGYKNKGQLIQDNTLKGNLLSDDSKINFIVPDVKVLKKILDESETTCQNPGILGENIKNFAVLHTNDSCKISLDGKKIISGFGKKLGDVDLFGHESAPK